MVKRGTGEAVALPDTTKELDRLGAEAVDNNNGMRAAVVDDGSEEGEEARPESHAAEDLDNPQVVVAAVGLLLVERDEEPSKVRV